MSIASHDGGKYDWITFIDGDEFIILNEDTSPSRHFSRISADYDSVVLNWHVFGHGGHSTTPPGLVIESLTRRMQEPGPLPSRCAALHAIGRPGVHLSRLKKGRSRVDANKNLIPGMNSTRVKPGVPTSITINVGLSRTGWERRTGRGWRVAEIPRKVAFQP